MKYEITKEQIKQLHDNAKQEYSSLIEVDLENWFPEAFNTELVVGKWFVINDDPTYLLNYQGENIDKIHYGFACHWGLWYFKDYHKNNCREATPSEIESSLINEAKKRGYKKGVTIQWKSRPKLIYTLGDDEFDYLESINVLVFGNYGIFERGEWAEILPQEKTVVPMEKALKIIAKKMKVSPENIEICSNTKE